MRKISVIILLFAAALQLTALNVRDFGAKGDGITDDTAAIQAAFNAVKAQETFVLAGYSELPEWGGHGGVGGYGKVFFPAGTYLISDTIVFDKRKVLVEGEDGTVIRQTNPAKDIFYFHHIFRSQFRNITFEGGACQLFLFTNNNDMTGLYIENCRFVNSSREAVNGETRTGNGKIIPPYDVKWENGRAILTPNDLTGAGWMNYSTVSSIVNCVFDNCYQALVYGGDTVVVKDTVVNMGSNSGSIALEFTYGNISLQNLKAYWDIENTAGKFWISSKSFMRMENVECDNTGANGIPLFYSELKHGYCSASLEIRNCRTKSAGNEFDSIIRVKEDTLPSIINIEGLTETSGRDVQLISFEKVPDEEGFQNNIRYPHWKLPANYIQKIVFSNNSPCIDESLPAYLENFHTVPVAPECAAAAAVLPADKNFWPCKSEYPEIVKVNVPDLNNGNAAIQQALDNALPGTTILLPAARIILDNTLMVPAGIAIMGDGVPLLTMKDGISKPIMQVTAPGRNFFGDLAFAAGSEAVVLAEGDETVAAFDNCGFFNQSNYGVLAPPSLAVRIANSIFYTDGGIDSQAVHTELFANWACNHPLMNEKGFFVNRGGEMLSDHTLFVPILPRVFLEYGIRTVPGCEDLDNGNNVRWFDNYGKIHVLNNRIGGEFVGMTPLWNFTDTGSVFIEGGFAWYGNSYVKNCMVYCVEVPALIILRDIINCAEGRKDGPWNIMVLDRETGEDLINPVGLPVIASALEKYSS